MKYILALFVLFGAYSWGGHAINPGEVNDILVSFSCGVVTLLCLVAAWGFLNK